MRSTPVRWAAMCLWGVVALVSSAGRAVQAQEPTGWPGPNEVTYVSRGLGFERNWGTFVLHPGDGGRAMYRLTGALHEVRLQFVAEFPSSTNPHVLFAVYRETAPNPAGKIRQWAFQVDCQTFNGYVIYYKDDQSNAWDPGWVLYDFAGRNPGW